MKRQWVVIYINTFQGRIEPYGPFGSEEEANEYLYQKAEPMLWSVKEIRNPSETQR